MMFAEITNSEVITWGAIIGISIFAANVATVWAVFRRSNTQISPQPFEVKAAAEFVQRDVFDRHLEENRKDHENLFSKIGGVDRGATQRIENQMQAIRTEQKGDINALHEKVNGVNAKVAGLEKSTELQNQQLAKLDVKLDRIIENKLTPPILGSARISPNRHES